MDKVGFHSVVNSIIDSQVSKQKFLVLNVVYISNVLGKNSSASKRSIRDRLVKEMKAAGYLKVTSKDGCVFAEV